MNEPKSSRYHRLRRRASVISLAGTTALLATMLWLRPELSLWPYVLTLVVLQQLVTLPPDFYGTFLLDREYELSTESAASWLGDRMKMLALMSGLIVAGVEVVYGFIRSLHGSWWWNAAIVTSVVVILLARFAPVYLLPIFYTLKPLERLSLHERLRTLSGRAGVPVLGVYEWALGERTRRARAVLAGTGGTRRILLSDTLLAAHSDDEIEVILAHELAHHVHRDVGKAMAAEILLIFAAFYASAAALEWTWGPLGLAGPADVRGLPVLLLAGGAVMVAGAPLTNALSRANERRADRFAVSLTGRADAFISAMTRLGAQNLVEENPSKATVWLYHSHPPVEERIEAARRM